MAPWHASGPVATQPNDNLRGFELWLRRSRMATDRQIRQAADAVSLYCGQYKKLDGGNPESRLETTHEPQSRSLDPPAALAELRRLLELRHYAPSTLSAYLGWSQRYLNFLGRNRKGPPTTADAQAFLSYLATRRKVAAATQNQAFNALLFLHRYVYCADFGDMKDTVRARRRRKLPVVLTIEEVRALFAQLRGLARIMLAVIYGGGLRLNELVQLRVKDLDFDAGTITIRAGKGDTDRVTLLPKRLHPGLQKHLERVKAKHHRDLNAGAWEAPLPNSFKRKYPNAGLERYWQFVFPSSTKALRRP
ncbi:MAG: phage integrase N-terminal SAM-like domain-containing protein [Candidatus Eisenbacteria bacterium]|nr:phage integrase N-terminal SAM-like domain-containing protein [Candidatus Eisenbacteria bacterium]MBU1948952.1 phage integrase N-terminal SAM-like domain-containing protein [Candidatus Eisenbacteria bacterium]